MNAWALARDPKSWEDANMLRPERFIGNPIDIKGKHFQMIPFGLGRKGCTEPKDSRYCEEVQRFVKIQTTKL